MHSLSTPGPRALTRLLTTALGAGTLAALLAAPAQATSGFERGPDPTTASLEAAAGPYQVASVVINSPVGYKGGTVYYPKGNGPFALVVFAPGFIETQSWNAWWAQYLASHGFVVVNIDTTSTFAFPPAREREQLAALKDVIKRSNTRGTPFYGLVDATRLGAMGHSMGGGATLELARDTPNIKAIVPMAPFQTQGTDYSRLKVPTLILACKGDVVATAKSHSDPIYDSLSHSLDKAYVELAGGGGHPCTTSLGTSAEVKKMAAKYGVSWLKRFLDQDTRYTPFLCGEPHEADLKNPLVSAYEGSCPY